MSKNSESHAPTETGQQPTYTQEQFDVEKNAKNEIYHFILSNGLFDKYKKWNAENIGKDHHAGCLSILATQDKTTDDPDTGQTTRRYLDDNILNIHKEALFGQLEDLFNEGGITMPLELLHEYACDRAEYLETLAKEVEDEGESVEAFTLNNMSNSIFRITYVMWKLAAIYESYERYKWCKGKE